MCVYIVCSFVVTRHGATAHVCVQKVFPVAYLMTLAVPCLVSTLQEVFFRRAGALRCKHALKPINNEKERPVEKQRRQSEPQRNP